MNTTTTLRAFGVIFGLMLLYLLIAGIVGYVFSVRPGCPDGYRAISADGRSSITSKDPTAIISPTPDFPICSSRLSCPQNGPKWAVHQDGSALTNTCDVENCPCTSFQHCPSYVNVVFRQFGYEQRVSLFQVIDPQITDEKPAQDPYDPPYILEVGSRDSCYLTSSTINMLWPPLALGQPCLEDRGILATMQGTPSLMLCAPNKYVDVEMKNGITTSVFMLDRYLQDYKPQ